MTTIYSQIGIADTDRGFIGTVGQSVVYDLAAQFVAQRSADLMAQLSLFVAGTTSAHIERFKLPGGGFLEQRGATSPVASAKSSGSWDVAYPLFDFGRAITTDYVARGYMTAGEMQVHIDGVIAANANTVRFQLLRRLFNNTVQTFVDDLHGTLSVQPLANGDAVIYPAPQGSTVEGTADHYLESNYAASAISDANNPLATIEAALSAHFGSMTGGSNIVVLINSAQRAKIEALTNFVEVPDNFIVTGSNTDVPTGYPMLPSSARLIGRSSGTWVAVYDWMPVAYMMGVHLEAPAPLRMRVDPADTGLGQGLQLISTDTNFPLQTASYVNRFGFGTGNRLNGVVMELGTGGSYTIPAGYTF